MSELPRESKREWRVFRSVVVLDIVWREPVGKEPDDDWGAVVAQALNAEGALWDVTSSATTELRP